MTGIVAHTYPEWWLKLTGQVAHWSTDYSKDMKLRKIMAVMLCTLLLMKTVSKEACIKAK